MKLQKLISIGLIALLPISFTAIACSSLAIVDKNNNVYHGRTLELSEDLPSWITFYPKATFFQKLAPDGSKSISYTSKYDILSITTDVYNDGDRHNMFQGLNDAGLSFSANMISNFQLDPISADHYKNSIPYTSLGEWALSNFSTTDEIANAIKTSFFWAPTLEAFGGIQAPFHFAFYDKNGKSIVVEASNGTLHVYDNPTKVMTNGPEFPWHLQNLNNYTQLNNVDKSSGILGGIKVVQPDSGIAVADLPASDTSVGRFIRAVYYATYAPKPDNQHDAINTLAHIMNRFDRLKDITVDISSNSREKSSEYTVWTTLTDLSGGNVMVKGYKDIDYTKYSFDEYKNNKKPVFVKINTDNSN